jgi:hypothetical protein
MECTKVSSHYRFTELAKSLDTGSTVSDYESAYDRLRQELPRFLNHFTLPDRRGYNHRDNDVVFEDLLVGADVFFTTLKDTLQLMTEAQDIIDNWEEEDPESSPDYAQAVGEVFMAKKIFLLHIASYTKLETQRLYVTRDAMERPSAYGSREKPEIRFEFFSTVSRREGQESDRLNHPNKVSHYFPRSLYNSTATATSVFDKSKLFI